MRKKTLTNTSAIAIAACFFWQNAAAEAARISFADVLKDPANLELNIDYAIQQMDAGDLLSAAAALERVLIAAPDADQARLLYAVVLFRMDDKQGAAAELSKVKPAALSATAQQDYAYYKERTDEAENPFSWEGQLVAGVSYDDNVLSVVSDTFGFLTEMSDTSATLGGRLGIAHDLSATKDVRFVAAVEGFTKSYFDAEGFDYSTFYGEAGLEGRTGPLDWSALVAGRTVLLEGDTYLNQVSLNGSLARDITPKTTAALSVSVHDKNYNDVTVNGFSTFGEDGRSGDGYAADISLQHRFDTRHQAAISLGWAEEDADFFGFDYDGLTASASFAKDWREGIYTDVSYAYQQREFAQIFREDDLHYVRASVGVPFRLITSGGRDDISLKQLEAMTLELAVFNETRDSNLFFFEYENTGIDLRFVWAGGE